MPDTDYPPALAHDPIREVMDGVYWVHGTTVMAPGMILNRNMVILRDGTDLTLVSPVRLTEAGLRDLAALGTVRHVVRLGHYHGLDDRFYVETFGAEFWCQPGSDHYPRPQPTRLVTEETAPPVPETAFFLFRGTKHPEAALLVSRGDGLLVTCDSLQNYDRYSRCSLAVRAMMPLLGFRKSTVIGPMWRRKETPPGGSVKPDFDRLLALDFDSLIAAHGTPKLGGAKAAARRAVETAFGGA